MTALRFYLEQTGAALGMIPVSFGGCAGWYHPAAGARGVVLVSPDGFEELCSRRAMRELADLLAEAGLPTLRFDLRGVADSVDLAAGEHELDAWASDIAA